MNFNNNVSPARRGRKLFPRLSKIAIALSIAFGQAAYAEVKFNSGFLRNSAEQSVVNLDVFAKGDFVLPGTHRVDLYVNQERVDLRDILFNAPARNQSAIPCISKALLREIKVLVDAIPLLAAEADGACVDIAAAIPDAAVSYDSGQQRLDISIPQAMIRQNARGTVPQSEWDHGINAGMLDYSLRASDGSSAGRSSQQSYFANLRSGLNLGPWRFRNASSYNKSYGSEGSFQSIATYAERDVQSIGGRVLVGDSYTSDRTFQSMQFRGVQISSDDNMLPDSMQGYAPVIRGVARTNAKVEVKQNGHIVYSTVVAPGPFVINDLYPSSSSGDLEVTVTEADGQQTRFIQPFAAVPNMLREGASRYQVTAGQARSVGADTQPFFMQASYARGMKGDVTPYGGATLSSMYQAGALGVSKNFGNLGAVSIDVTHARSQPKDAESVQGQSWRFLYAKSLIQQGTDFRLLGYRYSTSGYRDFYEALQERRGEISGGNRKFKIEGTVTQSLGRYGSMYLTFNEQRYWGRSSSDRTLQLGYNAMFRNMSIGGYLANTRDSNGNSSNQASINVSIPLDMFGNRARTSSANLMMSRDGQGRLSSQAGVSGTLLEDGNLNYSAYAGKQGGQGGQGSLSANYQGSKANVDAGYSYGNGYRQGSVGVSGGIVAHAGGITFSQPLQDTMVLVDTSGAAGVGLQNQVGVKADSHGYAVIPYASPYRRNRVALNTDTLSEDTDVTISTLEVVPTKGAIVAAKFETSSGQRLLVDVTLADGAQLPIGAKVFDQQGKERGIVGPGSQVFLTGVDKQSNFNVKLNGSSDDALCSFSITPDQSQKAQAYIAQKAACAATNTPYRGNDASGEDIKVKAGEQEMVQKKAAVAAVANVKPEIANDQALLATDDAQLPAAAKARNPQGDKRGVDKLVNNSANPIAVNVSQLPIYGAYPGKQSALGTSDLLQKFRTYSKSDAVHASSAASTQENIYQGA
ncbi:fimbria/pilus outer membrane usher protein [Collimonas silvisoli]|uniref:fimbria/pilus outer membrane usher protein n=1 Tax=Collimonas silvisoli TaxID=2825884 RepID=UPI001B8B6728|nr:fimbria/pilus outer membrane usher protein [Collimonas silvisoli]